MFSFRNDSISEEIIFKQLFDIKYEMYKEKVNRMEEYIRNHGFKLEEWGIWKYWHKRAKGICKKCDKRKV